MHKTPNPESIPAILTLTQQLYEQLTLELGEHGTIDGQAPTQEDIAVLNRARQALAEHPQ